jgi:TusA-related sulfurtransferase
MPFLEGSSSGPPPGTIRTAHGNAIPKADLTRDAAGQPSGDLPAQLDQWIRQLEIGGVLEVRADAPDAGEIIWSWAQRTGNELVATQGEPGKATCYYLLRRGGPTPQRDPYS